MKKVTVKRVRSIKMCDPAICDYCQYIGEGDFICDRYIDDSARVLVVDSWTPTENYLQCQKRITRRIDKSLHPGSKVKVRGCYSDFTDHLDGRVVTVLKTDGIEAIVRDKNGSVWMVYVKNLLPEGQAYDR